MATATLSVVGGASGTKQSNHQRWQEFIGTLAVSARGDTYPAGGMALDSVLGAALPIESNSAPIAVLVWGIMGYIYTRIPSSGKLMVLQVPPTGSLTTAAPLQELSSASNSLSGVFADTITFRATYNRNA
jgi:hypothetical protein